MSTPCGIKRGYSVAPDPAVAVREFAEAIAQQDIGLVVFFCSYSYDLEILAPELRRYFHGIHVIGCTTAGEITPVGYLDGSITGFSIAASDCCAVSTVIENVSRFQMSEGHAAAERLIEALSEKGQAIDRKDTFALLLIDGMAANEEVVLASIHPLMDMIPLLGGSAGDNLRLTGAFVFFDGTFYPDAALLTVIKIRAPFRVLKCQHFGDSNVRMVVTRADPWKRTVSEINAEPAAREYARVLGLPESALTPTIFAEHPVMVKIGGDCHVRSIQRVNADDSLTFFCAIDEGVVLRLAQREDILANLADFFDRVNETLGPPQLVIGFDCILRSLALEKKQDKHSASEILAANNVIGFSTYGEQFASMHLNQTFTAVVIGAPHDTE